MRAPQQIAPRSRARGGCTPRGPVIEPLAELVFGRHGDAAPCLLHGWSEPEEGFTWSVGQQSGLRIPLVRPPPAGYDAVLAMDLAPFLIERQTPGQRLAVSVNGATVGDDTIEREGTVGYRIPAALLGDARTLLVELRHPDASRPADFGLNADARPLGFMLRAASVLPVPPEPAFTPRVLAPLDLPAGAGTEALKRALLERTGEAAGDLMMNFESLGHNCEFGIMQRHCGAEPLGLLRFAGITLPDLLRGLDCGFAGVGHDRWLRVYLHPAARPEFVVADVRHNISFHSFAYEDETTAGQVRGRQGQQLRFLHGKFSEVLRIGEKLLVFQRPGQTLAAHMLPLLTLLRHAGPNALLFVTEGGEHPPGAVEQIGARLYHGFTSRVAPGDDIGSGDLRAWLSICANAWKVWREP